MEKMVFRKWGWVAGLMAIVIISTGCGSTGKHLNWYAGPALGPDKVALLKIQRNFWGAILTVDTIDGQPLKKKTLANNNTEEVELLPGQHELQVSYKDAGNDRSVSDAKISFLAEAGKNYDLLGAPCERSFGKEMAYALTLHTTWYWTLWIVDSQTKKVIAGEPRTTPVHWYE
jgi:hypothetical protein